MLFSRIIPFLAFFITFAAFALAKPINTVMARGDDNSSVECFVTSISANANTILPEIKTLAAGGQATDGTVEPLIIQLIGQLTSAKESLGDIGLVSSVSSNATVATLLAGLIEDVVATLDALLAESEIILNLSGLLSGVDVALSEILLGLDLILNGILTLVGSLLSPLTVSLLGSLNMVQTLNVLNLSL